MPAEESIGPLPRARMRPSPGSTGILSVLVFCVLAGCATAPRPHIPPPSTTEKQRRDDPAREAQARLLAEAHRAFAQARYSTAVLFFTRYLDRAADSDRMAEARWWLGRAYEELGDDAAAMDQYRLIAGGALSGQRNGAVHEAEALRRLDELRQRRPTSPAAAQHVALRIDAWQDLLGSAERLREWAAAGVTALVPGPVSLAVDDANLRMLQTLVTKARRSGLLIYPAIDLHQPGQPFNPEWMGRSGGPDVANPGYAASVEAAAGRILESGCDGVFLQARRSPGFAGDMSADSLREFGAAFGLEIVPQALDAQETTPTEGHSLYWRWVGWKAAAYGKLIGALASRVRSMRPSGLVLVELHELTQRDALQGLVQYGEDGLDLRRRTGVVMVVRQEDPAPAKAIHTGRGSAEEKSRQWVEVALHANSEWISSEAIRRWVAAVPDDGVSIVIVPQREPAVP